MVGLVLSGGAARCIAHLGMMKVLEENRVKIDRVSGVSAGAIIATLYSCGYAPDEIMEIIGKTSYWNLLRPAFSNKGLLSMTGIEKALKKNLPVKTFEDLRLPVYVGTTHLKSGGSRFFSEGELIAPLLASNCVPFIFTPVKIDGELYVDGGILNNLPAEPLLKSCNKIIGLHSNPVNDHFQTKNYRFLMERIFLLAINYNAMTRKELCHVFWEPTELQEYRVTDLKKAKKIFEIGYHYAKSKIEELSAIHIVD